MNSRKKRRNSLLAFFMTFTMILGLAPNIYTQAVESAENEKINKDYEIYPIPQSIVYNGGNLNLSSEVNVIFEDGLDQATKDRLIEVLEIKNISHTIGTEIDESKTNFLIGIQNSSGIVDNYFAEKNLKDAEHFKHMDSHIVSVDNNVVAVLGKDTDSAFYGITTLKMIFNQLESNEIRNLLIKDYADAQWRGFIEGYYGIPWSNENRMSLMEFGGDIKMNAYMFAPKDDPYHNSQWREPYPEEKLAELAEMVKVGSKSKNKFIWTIHPFMHNAIRFDTEEHYQEDLAIIIRKFEYLYDIGVRQFGILGDDAGGNATDQVKLMTDLEEWKKSKGDVYNLIFVPKEYCQSFAGNNINSPYLKTISQMPKDIEIMWTGSGVCGWVTTDTFNWFMQACSTAENPSRLPFMWLNWPVNDINKKRLVMGKGQMLDPTVTNFKGIVTNPMQQAQASKVALFAVADYTWNRDTFNADKSWEDSFKYIDKDAGSELYTLAKHMSDPAPNGHGLVQDESEEIKSLLDEFNRKYLAGESIKEIGQTLINEYEKIVKAADDFDTKSKNEGLKAEIDPWRQSLKALAQSTIEYIKTAIAIEDGNNGEVWSHYSEGAAKFELSKTFQVQNIHGKDYVEAGYKRLIPFVKKLGDSLAGKVGDIVNPEEEKLNVTPYTNVNNVYQGNIQNIVDGDLNTKVWFGRYIQEGDYVALELSKSTKITSLSIEQGKNATDKDAFHYGKFQYSMDGETWTDVNNKTYGPYQNKVEVSNLDIEAKYVRFIVTGDIKAEGEANPKWASFREFTINKDINEGDLSLSLIKSSNIGKRSGGNEADILRPEGAASPIMYAKAPYEGADRDGIPQDAYIGVDLGREARLGKVHIVGDKSVPGDIFVNAVLEYSVNGEDYTEIETFTNKVEINKDYSQENIIARYVRLRNKTKTNVWARFTKFNVTESNLNTKIYTNVVALANNKVNIQNDVAIISNLNEITLATNEYVGIKLPRIKDLTEIVKDYTESENLTLETSMNEIEWETINNLNELQDARYIRIINKTENPIAFNLNNLEVHSLEYQGKTLKDTNFTAVENTDKAFDNDWTTQAWFKNNQDQGKYFTYDLGRLININSLKMVVNDYEHDYIRNGVIKASEDGNTWTDVLTIGGNLDGSAEISDAFPNHEISYNTISVAGLNINARYLRVEVTKTLNIAKWVRFNEIIINNGQYIPSENNPTFVSNPIEVAGYAPSNLIDGNLNTTYKPNKQDLTSGSLVYRISENTEITKINILQSPNTISNALVLVRTVDGWQEIGRLDRSLNDFITKGLGNILEVKLEWNEVAPTLHEIILSNGEQNVDKSYLESKLEEARNIDTSNWTQESKNALKDAIDEGDRVLEDKYASQNKVDDLIRLLSTIMENPEIVDTNKEELQALYNVNKDRVEADYTVSTWAIFNEALKGAEVILEKADVTQEEVNEAKANLENAVNQLKEKAKFVRHLEIAVEEGKKVSQEELDKVVPAVVEEFKAALAQAENLLNSNDAAQEDIDASFHRLSKAMHILSFYKGDKKELIALVAKINSLNSSDYITETWEALQIVLEKTNKVIEDENALEEEVSTAYEELLKAFLDLRLKPSKEKLEELIKKAESLDSNKYTEKTWNALEEELATAKNVLENEKASEKEINKITKSLELAINALEEKENNSNEVDKEKLVQLIEKANKYLDSSEEYTNESYEAFLVSLDEANKVNLNKNATQKMVDDVIEKLNKAIEGLVKKNEEKPGDNKPSTDNPGSNGNNSVDKNNGDNTSSGSNGIIQGSSNRKLPQTGGGVMLGYLGIGLLALGGIVTGKRRRKN